MQCAAGRGRAVRIADDRGDMIARFGGDDGGALRDGNALLGLILGLIARCVRRIG